MQRQEIKRFTLERRTKSRKKTGINTHAAREKKRKIVRHVQFPKTPSSSMNTYYGTYSTATQILAFAYHRRAVVVIGSISISISIVILSSSKATTHIASYIFSRLWFMFLCTANTLNTIKPLNARNLNKNERRLVWLCNVCSPHFVVRTLQLTHTRTHGGTLAIT